ncbi:MAG: DUF721 domain-containing protein [Acidobacteriia bacterium]|nr:DUF721 domain-containing protein [Terriglobia bacterium]
MEKAGDFLGRVVRRLDRPEAALAWLVGAWPAVAGKAIADHTTPLRCEQGRLELAADGKAWQQQLEPMQREIRDRINRAWGSTLVREVKFVPPNAAQGTSQFPPPATPHLAHAADNTHTPFIRRRRS